MSFDELEKALEDIDKYVRYEELIDYIIEKRKKDQSYNDLIKKKIIEIIDEYCDGKERKEGLISNIEILKSSREYEIATRLKFLVKSDIFMNNIVMLYKSKISSTNKHRGNLFIKCKTDLEGVYFESEPILETFDDKYIGNPDILKRVWKYLNTEVLVDSSSIVAMNEIIQLRFICTELYNILYVSDEEFNVLGCELLKNFYEEEMNRLSNDSENNNDDIERLRINYECLNNLLSAKGTSYMNASFIFEIIKDKLLDYRNIIVYLVNGKEYDINKIETKNSFCSNMENIRLIIESVYNEKTEQMIELTNNHSELNKAGKLTLVKNYNLFSQSVYVMYILQLIEKKPKSILNFTDNKKLEEYIVDKLIDMNILKDAYNEVLSNFLEEKFDNKLLKQLSDDCSTPASGKDLLQFLMYFPGNKTINRLTYDKNQEILVDAIFKIIYYEMAKKYTEDKIELVRKKYIELLQGKMEKLDTHPNLCGFGCFQFKEYCSKRRHAIENEIQIIKSVDTSGFISLILGKYIYEVYENSNIIKALHPLSAEEEICDVYENIDVTISLGRKINQIKNAFMDLCKEVFSDISFDNERFVVDKNGVTMYNVAVIKNALDEIVCKGGYGASLENVKKNVELQYEIDYCNFASQIENIEFCIWNKIFANFSAKLLEKMSIVKNKIINSKISITGLYDFVEKDDYEVINKMLEEDLKQPKRFVSKKKIENEREILISVQYIIAALKLQKDYRDVFSSEKYDKIAKDKNYFRLSEKINKMTENEEFKGYMDEIDRLLSYTHKCEFNAINKIIVELSKKIKNKNIESFNEIYSSPRKASDKEMNKFKELCDRLGKSIEETIRLLSNENNFVMLLGLVAGYDDTLIEIKEGIISFEQVFNINSKASYNLESNLEKEVTTLLVKKTEKYPQDTTSSLVTIDNNSTDDDLGPKLCKRLRIKKDLK